MLGKLVEMFKGVDAPQPSEVDEQIMADPAPEIVPEPEPDNELTSLLHAVRDQAVAIKVEHERIASASKREFETLTTRVATLAPLFAKAVDAQRENERAIARFAKTEVDLNLRLNDALKEASHYRPLAVKLEDELRVERGKLERASRDMAELELRHAKAQRRIEDLVQRVTSVEAEAQRTAEANTAFAQKVYESEFAIETLTREAAAFNSEIAALNSDVARQASEIADLTSRLAAERDAASRAKMELSRVQADFDLFRNSAEAAAKDFEGRERRTHETVAQRDWQIYDYETRHAAQESRIEFLSRKNESQREDIIRHLSHIAKLESTNRHLLDTLSRNAISIDDAAPDSERGVISPPKLRAVKDE